MNIKIQNTEDKVGLALFTLGIIFLLYTSYIGLFKLGVWIDEIYTLVLTTLPFDESFFIILNDVHPFLYYLIGSVQNCHDKLYSNSLILI
ncbi:MAG: hypothetical protein IJP99_02275 [Methanobrevibacter sp.]|nr:hypothetical protein [Methanobrevibacter sp.]